MGYIEKVRRLFIPALLFVSLLSSCGDAPQPAPTLPSLSPTTTDQQPVAVPGAVALNVRVYPVGKAGKPPAELYKPVTFTYRCNETGVPELPEMQAGCQFLKGLKDTIDFEASTENCQPHPDNLIEARVWGTFKGDRMEKIFKIKDSCQFDNWQRFLPILQLSSSLGEKANFKKS